MEDYNTYNQLKSELTTMIFEYEKATNKCVEKAMGIKNLNHRMIEFDECQSKNSKLNKAISDFKTKHNLKATDNWVAVGELDNVLKRIEETKTQTEFPLSDNKKWKDDFNYYNKALGYSYLKSYFRANDNLFYGQDRKVRELCSNNKTYDGQELRADDIINCILKAKKTLNS